MKKTLVVLLVSAMLAYFSLPLMASEKGTQSEVVEKCKQAAALIKDKGLDGALPQLSDKSGPFVWKDTYVFVVGLDKKTILAHPVKPKLVGRKLIGIKNVNGKMFFAEFISVAQNKGEGWVDYMWPKPGEKKPSPKKTYVLKVPGMPVAVLAGIYK